LFILTPVYRLGWWWKNRRFRNGRGVQFTPTTPTICVGNITTGGTGKTPMVIWLCNFFQEKSLAPIVFSRGYGKPHQYASDDDQSSQPLNPVNDEFLEIQFRLPNVEHRQSPNRVALAKKCDADDKHDVILLDDGFQHRILGRHLDLVLIDATCPWGFDFLLPRGLLREPRSQLRRATAIVITRCDQIANQQLTSLESEIQKVSGGKPVFRTQTIMDSVTNGTVNAPLEHLKDKRLFAFAGIGNPHNFQYCLEGENLNVASTQWFADHHHYSTEDLSRLARDAKAKECAAMVCTMKDFVKINENEIDGLPLWAVLSNLKFVDDDRPFRNLLNSVFTIQLSDPENPTGKSASQSLKHG